MINVKLFLTLVFSATVVDSQSTSSSRNLQLNDQCLQDVTSEIESIRRLLIAQQNVPVCGESQTLQKIKSQVEEIRQQNDNEAQATQEIKSQVEETRQQNRNQDQAIQRLNSQIEEIRQAVRENERRTACPPGFDYLRETSSCLRVIPKRMNWDDATAKCRQVMPGVHMVTITSQAENDAIVRYLQSIITGSNNFEETNYLWIGGQTRDPRQCGSYFWKPLAGTEIPFSYTNWSPGSPDCWRGEEHCPAIVEGYNYKWNDTPCDSLCCYPICQLRV